MDARKQHIFHLLGQTVHVEIDRPIGHIQKGMTYPINYGYIPGLLAGDGEDQDVYVLGVDIPLTSFDGQVIGAICRKDDVEDKLVVAPAGLEFHQGELAKATHFQEQYFDSYVHPLFHKSCGVLPWQQTPNGRRYLLVFEQFSQCWSLPKGHMEMGETEAETALRELWEETGLTARLDTSLRASIEYPLGAHGRKQVVFFPGQVSGTPKVRHGEIEGFQWVTAEQLQKYLFPDTVLACTALIETLP